MAHTAVLGIQKLLDVDITVPKVECTTCTPRMALRGKLLLSGKIASFLLVGQ